MDSQEEVMKRVDVLSKYSFIDKMYSRFHSNQIKELISDIEIGKKESEVLRWYISGVGKADAEYIGTKTIFQTLREDVYDYVRARLKDTATGENGKIFDDSFEIFEKLTKELFEIEKEMETTNNILNLAEVYLGKLENLFLRIETIQVIGDPEVVMQTLDYFQTQHQERLDKFNAILETPPDEEGKYETAPGRKISKEVLEQYAERAKSAIESYDAARQHLNQVRNDIARLFIDGKQD